MLSFVVFFPVCEYCYDNFSYTYSHVQYVTVFYSCRQNFLTLLESLITQTTCTCTFVLVNIPLDMQMCCPVHVNLTMYSSMQCAVVSIQFNY